jgi:hypothetical protein
VLRSGAPAVACACTWRSLKWRIAPDDFTLALRLIEAMATDEGVDWTPSFVLSEHAGRGLPEGPWLAVSRAVEDRDQRALDQAVADAARLYSPVGFRLFQKGYGRLLTGLQEEHGLTLPEALA